MEFGILGPLVVSRDGRKVEVGATKPRAVLALLVLRHEQVVSTETLVEEIWGDHPPVTATKVIHGYVYQLRKALGDGLLQTEHGGYRLRVAADDVDAVRFESLIRRGRVAVDTGDPRYATAMIREALALWRGPPLTEFGSYDFAADERDRLRELRLEALECRIEADLALGNLSAAVLELRALVIEHPFRETLRGQLMLALYRAGRQADALAAYRDTRTLLIEELGIEPGEDLQLLHAEILAHDQALGLPAPTRAAVAVTGRPPAAPRGHPASRTEPAPVARLGRSPDRHRSPIRASRAGVIGLAAAVVAASAVAVVLRPVGTAADFLGSAPTVTSPGVAFVDHDGIVGRQVTLPGPPTAIAVDGHGVWVVVPADDTLVRIDAASGTVVGKIPVGRNPSDVMVGGGAVWVANHADGTVSRVSPATDGVVETITVGTGPMALAEGDGSIWVTNGDDRTLTRVDERSGRVVATIDTDATGRGVAVDGGTVWVTDEATGRVIGVDAVTDAVVAAVQVGNGPTGITAATGVLWVVNALDGTVSRLDVATSAVNATVQVPGGPAAISAGDGVVWVGAEFGSQLVRIDAASAEVTGTSSLGGGLLEGVAASGSGAWVGVQASGAGHHGGRLVVEGAADSIDPSVGDMPPATEQLAYDALTTVRHASGAVGTEIMPDLASSLPAPTGDGTSYTFHLRPQIRYSDGRQLQAADLRRGLQRLLQLDAKDAPAFAHLAGATACLGQPICSLPGIEVTDPLTITFRLSSADPRFLEELSLVVPIPDTLPIDDVGTAPVPGTGPYSIQTFVPGRVLTFERNRFFQVWSPAARPDGYPDEIVYRNDGDDDVAVEQVASGRADVAELVGNPAAAGQFAIEHPAQVYYADQQATVFVFLNVRTPPFDDVRVRRAFNYAVDRRQVADLYGAALARPTCQIVAPSTTGYRPYCPYTVDPDAGGSWRGPDLATAQALVDASGSKGQDVQVWTFPDFAAEATAVTDVLTELGYHATVREITDTTGYFESLERDPEVQAGMFGWFDSPLAVDMLSALTCDFDPNPANFCDPQLDAGIHQLAEIEPSDPAAAGDLAADLDRKITDQAPWVPLFTPQTVTVTSARVGNVQAAAGLVLLDQLWVQ